MKNAGTGCSAEVSRLEKLWGGDFGNDYIRRNMTAGDGRQPFWEMLFKEFEISSILEVGCNIGGNLRWLARKLPVRQVYGVDINEQAVMEVKKNIPGVNAIYSPARNLPFKDGFFDMVFTTGVLIHQTPEALPSVMNEIVRTSGRYVLCGEYYADKLTEVPYRGETGALFKCDFGGIYKQNFPGLDLVKEGFLPREQGGWDDVRYWVFEKTK